MITQHSVGDKVNGFRIEEVLGEGYFAFSYRAKSADGRDIYLKQYKEPSSKDPRFNDYLKYKLEVKRRIDDICTINIVDKIVDIFDWDSVIYQALEFVPDRTDLWDFIENHHKPDKSKENWDKQWEKRIRYATNLMFKIVKLHESGIIHSDLKPQNIVLVNGGKDSNKSNDKGHKKFLRIAGLDWSIIKDRRDIPWKYAKGTVGYCSPEHINGEMPVLASDVFTCGIILYLLLCDRYPFDCNSRETYKIRILNNDHVKPALLDKYPNVENEVICQMLKRCLDPDPTNRPTAKEVHEILLGSKGDKTEVPKGDKTPKGGVTAGRVSPTKPNPSPKNDIELTGSIGSTNASIKADIGKDTLKSICGDDGKYADTKQYALVRDDESWFIVPNPDAANETLLNGKKIVEKTLLKSGDQIGVGREEKGIVKAIVTVKLSSSEHSEL